MFIPTILDSMFCSFNVGPFFRGVRIDTHTYSTLILDMTSRFSVRSFLQHPLPYRPNEYSLDNNCPQSVINNKPRMQQLKQNELKYVDSNPHKSSFVRTLACALLRRSRVSGRPRGSSYTVNEYLVSRTTQQV